MTENTTVPDAKREGEARAATKKPKKPLNVLGLIALITAALGFIFACIPGALIVGWILLPIAFVLALVSLFLKDKPKWMGITALILSIVGTIVGFAVFFSVGPIPIDLAGHTFTLVQHFLLLSGASCCFRLLIFGRSAVRLCDMLLQRFIVVCSISIANRCFRILISVMPFAFRFRARARGRLVIESNKQRGG